MNTVEKIFLEGVDFNFLSEIAIRSAVMFFFILCVLRLSGRRGVRQLTLFEVAIILGLGSAAGDPMFQPDIPILYALVVLFTVIIFYKFITWAASRSSVFNKLMEGQTKVIIRDGMFDVQNERKQLFSQKEFFAELRNQSVEHVGQVRLGLLEVDGTLSLLFYEAEHTRYGLPLFPDHYRAVEQSNNHQGPVACMYCGMVMDALPAPAAACPRCKHRKWALAMNTRHI